MEKVSIIATVKNEEKTIKQFLNSLALQTKSPEEIIIVDGGSKDRTINFIKSYIKRGFQINLLIADGVNIAEGRNIAIENTNNQIIASTDAGCRLDKNWLKHITKPFIDPNVDIVSGWYKSDPQTDFEKIIAGLTYPKLNKILNNPSVFLPSSRSISFKKSCWRKVGGYPEWLTLTGEDTFFDIKLKENGYNFYFAKDAIVYWRPRSSLKKFIKQQYLYGVGNGQAKIKFHELIKRIIFYSIVIILLVLGLISFYFAMMGMLFLLVFWINKIVTIKKNISLIKIIFWVPITQSVRDFSYIWGVFMGFFRL